MTDRADDSFSSKRQRLSDDDGVAAGAEARQAELMRLREENQRRLAMLQGMSAAPAAPPPPGADPLASAAAASPLANIPTSQLLSLFPRGRPNIQSVLPPVNNRDLSPPPAPSERLIAARRAALRARQQDLALERRASQAPPPPPQQPPSPPERDAPAAGPAPTSRTQDPPGCRLIETRRAEGLMTVGGGGGAGLADPYHRGAAPASGPPPMPPPMHDPYSRAGGSPPHQDPYTAAAAAQDPYLAAPPSTQDPYLGGAAAQDPYCRPAAAAAAAQDPYSMGAAAAMPPPMRQPPMPPPGAAARGPTIEQLIGLDRMSRMGTTRMPHRWPMFAPGALPVADTSDLRILTAYLAGRDHEQQHQLRQRAAMNATHSNGGSDDDAKPSAGSKRDHDGMMSAPMAAPPKPVKETPLGPPPKFKKTKPTPLYLPSDDDDLSEYQVLVRKQIEAFQADKEDTATSTRGRNRPIVAGQVGIRCRHCTVIPPQHRQRAAIYYPSKLDRLYQMSQTIASLHLAEHCQHIPSEIRAELSKLREAKSAALGGKKYWADAGAAMGLVEYDKRIFYDGSKEPKMRVIKESKEK